MKRACDIVGGDVVLKALRRAMLTAMLAASRRVSRQASHPARARFLPRPVPVPFSLFSKNSSFHFPPRRVVRRGRASASNQRTAA